MTQTTQPAARRLTGSEAATRTATEPRRPWLAAYAAQLAVGAYVGALGLTTGFLELDGHLERRLPLGSPVLAAAALTVLVGVPATVVMVMAWRGHRWAMPAAVLEGGLLMGWIVTEVTFIRELSFLQPFYFAVGAGLVVWGRAAVVDLVRALRHLVQRDPVVWH